MRRLIREMRADSAFRNFCLVVAAYYGIFVLALYLRLERSNPDSTLMNLIFVMILAIFFMLGFFVGGAMLLYFARWVVKISDGWAVLILSIPCALFVLNTLD